MDTSNPNPKVMVSSSDVVGTDVRNLQDESVGSIDHLMFYSETGEIAYAVLKVNTGFLNMDSKYFAIPWRALSFTRASSSGEDVITLDVDKEKLENAPGYDTDNPPLGPQTEFVNEIHHYYGIESHHRM
ncbi:PRC-barrel domain-containing protein [Litoribacter ruber]|uniref:PRC-barrel domain-containing protein n=1 Tax=Litoribacter ruber TaxID=702568 RepID=A0AAP2G619_9BACT|nr:MULTISPECIES: PRC-barrel domain-containing protein [Litoribacter]MBS9525621.1 PRC-barrel domain-containing protein [Litoribacter alkaliphilus]MBT0812932.1 PRC-barrel domain-containing protein [Litoribacter ruber]